MAYKPLPSLNFCGAEIWIELSVPLLPEPQRLKRLSASALASLAHFSKPIKIISQLLSGMQRDRK
jgi:hypothetical protein